MIERPLHLPAISPARRPPAAGQPGPPRRTPWRHRARSLLLGLAGGLSVLGASPPSAPAWYTVRAGDSLSRIGGHFGVSTGDLRAANPGLDDVLQPGQQLQIARPWRLARESSLRWHRPLAAKPGRALRPYGLRPGRSGGSVPHTGVDVATPLGTPILSPAHGIVRYCGPQPGFGNVVILEHGLGYSTVLAPVAPDSARCRVGEAVLRGDVLGRVDLPEECAEPYLHVELRRGKEAIAPAPLLR